MSQPRIKTDVCPHCRQRFEFSRNEAGKVVACPICWVDLEISPDAFAAEEAAEENLRQEGARLAKLQAKIALQAAAKMVVGMLWAVAGLCFVAMWLGNVELASAVQWVGLPGIGVTAFAFIIVVAAKLPWYVLTAKATAKAVEKHHKKLAELAQRQADEEAVRRKVEEEQRALEENERKLEAEAAKRKKREEKERKERLTDAGQAACWRNLGWYDFEIAVLLLFEYQGYEAQATTPTKDAGLDGIVSIGGESVGIQCKHFGPDKWVQVGEVRDFVGALFPKGFTRGFYVNTGQYGPAAKKYAEDSWKTSVKITLFDIDDLAQMADGLRITRDTIAEAKRRWNVPQEPPPDIPQGPRRRRKYRRYRNWRH